MRLKNIPGAREKIAESGFVEHDPKARRAHWNRGEYQKLWMELGMGKGKFLYTMAQQNPDILFLGVEKYSSVLYKAILRMEEAPLTNLCFLREDAEELPLFFDEGEAGRIFLNFSDPWPKDRHAKRRLTSSRFLDLYQRVLEDQGEIHFKTDNVDLFEFSVEQFEEHPAFELLAVTRDLHHDGQLVQGNIMTEYEERFSRKGQKICKLVARKNNQ